MGMRNRKRKLPELKTLRSVQLVLDLPQMKIESGARVLVLAGKMEGKTGRVHHIYLSPHCISFPGGKFQQIDRTFLVEIE